MASVRRVRQLENVAIPEICVLEFDGDLTDELVERGEVIPFGNWPCFHTKMWLWRNHDLSCGIVSRTIGGPYAVLIAEQLIACGARAVLGITSAGQVSKTMPVPGVVLIEAAVRDEGTSFHYLPPSETVEAHRGITDAIEECFREESLPMRRGMAWTTDAPYRETAEQLAAFARGGVLAVEMQAASLFAFGKRVGVPVGMVAHVTNGSDSPERDFDKGDAGMDRRLLFAVCRGAERYLRSGPRESTSVGERHNSQSTPLGS